jgi:hypothetical protein
MGRNRARVSVTVDPGLLKAVDQFVGEHTDADRSKVFDEALRLWWAEQLRHAMEAQYAPGGDPPAEEYEAWRKIRDASAAKIFGRLDNQRQ